MEFYPTDEAVKMRPDHEKWLRMPDGRRDAERVIKGGRNDKMICAPWLLSDIFSVPKKAARHA